MYDFICNLVHPFFLMYLLSAVAILLLWRHGLRRSGLAVMLGLWFSLGVACTPAIAYLVLGSLEWRYPSELQIPDDAKAIVVLGGNLLPPDEYNPYARLGPSTIYRVLHAEMIYRRFGPRPLVVSGGRMPDHPDHALADVMSDFLITRGIPDSAVVVESRSTTTYENAVEVGRLLHGQNLRKIVLVTDATHLVRAERCFVAQGFKVIPAPCSRRATRFRWQVNSLLPNAMAANGLACTAHEWLGILWYWINRRI